MLVDDDTTNNMICEFTIKRFHNDADIQIFTVPEKALSFIEEGYNRKSGALPTLLLLDINMPTMSGWEFLDVFSEFDDALKKQFSIYILSSSIEDFTKDAANYKCLQGFLSKPFKMNDLEVLEREP